MANLSVQPYQGPYSIDFPQLKGVLKDVNAGGTRGMRREKPGIEKVENEIKANIPVFAEILAPVADMPARFDALTQNLGYIRAARVIVDKLAEVLEESEAYYEDERESEIGVLVNVVRDAARRKDPSVLTAFEEAIRYHGQIANRAAKTRRKNEAQAEAAEEAGDHGTEPETPATSLQATP